MAVIPKVTDQLRDSIRQGLKKPTGARRGGLGPLARRLRPVAADLARFTAQTAELKARTLKHVAAKFRDEDENKVLEVLLAPDLLDFQQSYDDLMETMRVSNIQTEAVSESRAEDIFVERVAEFLSIRSPGGRGGGSGTTGSTIVHTNRAGDSVLYCLGYFVSTATAFGISTPAFVNLKGRYSFGIIDNGVQKFDGVVWTCPNVVQVDLP